MAVLSHHVADVFLESKQTNDVRNEAILNGADLVVGVLTNKLPQVIVGAVAGNAMDIIDKVIAPKVFGVEPNTVFVIHREPKPGYQLTEKDTIRCDVVATGLACMTLLMEK